MTLSTNTPSNSSKPLRDQLKATYVLVPEVNDRVLLSKYVDLAKNLFAAAQDAETKNEAVNTYINFQKLLVLLLDRLPHHAQYRQLTSDHPIRKWIKDIAKVSLVALENVCRQMDTEEDERQAMASKMREQALESYLLDELEDREGLGGAASTAAAAAQVVSPPSSPPATAGPPMTFFENSINRQSLQQLTAVDVDILLNPSLISAAVPASPPLLSSPTTKTGSVRIARPSVSSLDIFVKQPPAAQPARHQLPRPSGTLQSMLQSQIGLTPTTHLTLSHCTTEDIAVVKLILDQNTK
jgi:hypothetical protein